MTDHPITPLHELIYQWKSSYLDAKRSLADLLTEAYQTGADQELEACCKWADFHCSKDLSLDLRADRRPKPPSLKQQALKDFDALISELDRDGSYSNCTERIRRALKVLPDD